MLRRLLYLTVHAGLLVVLLESRLTVQFPRPFGQFVDSSRYQLESVSSFILQDPSLTAHFLSSGFELRIKVRILLHSNGSLSLGFRSAQVVR